MINQDVGNGYRHRRRSTGDQAERDAEYQRVLEARGDQKPIKSTTVNGVELFMNNPRRRSRGSKVFEAAYPGVCSTCDDKIKVGTKIRYDRDGMLVHAIHKRAPNDFEICRTCCLVKPCECDQ